MSTVKSFLEPALDGVKREDENREKRQTASWTPNRFYVPAGQKKSFIFIDDEPLGFYEHNAKINGDWRNYFTCIHAIHDDIVCCEKLGNETRYYVAYYTVIDCSEWTDKKGGVHSYEVKLLQAKSKTLKNLAGHKEDRGSLVGKMFTARRLDGKSPACGDQFSYDRDVEMDKLLQVANYRGQTLPALYQKASEDREFAKKLKATFNVVQVGDVVTPKIYPFNYYKLFEPKTPQQLREILGSYTPEGSDHDVPVGQADEAVPF